MPQDYLRFGIITRLVARFLHRLILMPHGKDSSTGGGAVGEERHLFCYEILWRVFI